MGHTWISQLETLVVLGVCVFAWLKGGPPERYGALFIFVTNAAADVAMRLAPRGAGHTVFPDTIVFTLDFVLAVGLLILAIRYSSMWLGAAMLLQSAGLGLHGLEFVGDGVSRRAYITAIVVMTMLMMLCIAAGTIVSWRRRIRERETGAVRSSSTALYPGATALPG